MPYTYKYPRPALTVDIVVFGFDGTALQVLLIERAASPFAGCWALPGGFVEIDETLEAAAARELAEETGLRGIFLEQLYTFGQIDRDPRERVVSVSYYALVGQQQHVARAASDARQAAWFEWTQRPKLAFDHNHILQVAIERLRGKIRYQPIGFELLPREFTLSQLQQLYQAILGTELDKRNFRRKVLAYDLLVPLDQFQRNVPHRAARLYRFDRRRYKQLTRAGFNFEV